MNRVVSLISLIYTQLPICWLSTNEQLQTSIRSRLMTVFGQLEFIRTSCRIIILLYSYLFFIAFIPVKGIVMVPLAESSRVDFDVGVVVPVSTGMLTAVLSLVEEVNDRVLISVRV